MQAHGKRVCEWCKEAISQDATVCPHCRRARKGVAMDKSAFLAIMAVVTAVLLSGIVALQLKGISDDKAARTVDFGERLNYVDPISEPTPDRPMDEPSQ
ncbi:MAG: hypothetical protein ABIJ28_03100 [Patescibacteria group bacterium]